MISGISQNDPTANSSGTNSATSGKTAATGTTQVTKNMFLQLLVAQIKNQDPMSPSDGAQFLAQLAQFQQLEQSMNSAPGSVGHPQRSGPAGTDLRHRGHHIYHQLIGDIHVHIVFDGSFRAQRHLHGG